MVHGVYSHAELREMILPLLDRYGMASASLFGSYAREEASERSDIDVLLVGRSGLRRSCIRFRVSLSMCMKCLSWFRVRSEIPLFERP